MQYIAYAIIGFTSLANAQPLLESVDLLNYRVTDWAIVAPEPADQEIVDANLPVNETTTATVATEQPEAAENVAVDNALVSEDDCNEVQDLEETIVSTPITTDVERISHSWPELNEQTRAAILMLIEADQLTR